MLPRRIRIGRVYTYKAGKDIIPVRITGKYAAGWTGRDLKTLKTILITDTTHLCDEIPPRDYWLYRTQTVTENQQPRVCPTPGPELVQYNILNLTLVASPAFQKNSIQTT